MSLHSDYLSVPEVVNWLLKFAPSTSLQHTHEHQSDCNNKMQRCHKLLKLVETSGDEWKNNILAKWRLDIGMAWSTKKEETTHQRCTKLHDNIPIIIIVWLFISNNYKGIGMVSCSFVHHCWVMTPCFLLFGASSHPYIPLHCEEMIFPLV